MSYDIVFSKADVIVQLISLTLYTEVAKFFTDCDRCVTIYTDRFWRQIQYKNQKINCKHSICLTKIWELNEIKVAHKLKKIL